MEQDVIWIGIDVGRYFHAFCAVDAAGRVVWERKRVPNTTVAMSKALDQLHRFAKHRCVRWATEEPGGNASALVRLLREAGEQVYLAQALRVHRFHLALGQPHKSDPYDAQVIAEFARQNAGKLPPVRGRAPGTEALRVLSRRLEMVSKDIRRCVNRLRGLLAEYAPEWLSCRVFGCWTTEAALHTLQRYARISKLQRTSLSRLTKALQQWTRGHLGEAQARTLREALASVSLPPEVEEAYVEAIQSLVSQIRGLLTERERLLQLIAKHAQSSPQMTALQQEFGYGMETGAVIISEIGDIRDFSDEAHLATYCGVTPIKRRSGLSPGSTRLSRFTNRRLLRALIQSSYSAAHHHPESKVYYQKKLAGRTDPRAKTNALIALARHRVRRLYRLLLATTEEQMTAVA
jgi:transposase